MAEIVSPFLAEPSPAAARLAHAVRDYRHARHDLGHAIQVLPHARQETAHEGGKVALLALAQEKGVPIDAVELEAYLRKETQAGA